MLFPIKCTGKGGELTDLRYFSTVLAEHQLSLSYATYIVNIRGANTWEKRGGNTAARVWKELCRRAPRAVDKASLAMCCLLRDRLTITYWLRV